MSTSTAVASSLVRVGTVAAWQARSYRRTWRATLTTAFLNPIFFLLSVGVLLGQLVDERQAALGGLSYVEFVAPGLLAATAMQMGASDGTYPVMAGIRWLRTYHAVVATPVRVVELVLGRVGWVAIRIAVASVVFAVVAGAGGVFESPLGILAPAAALLCGLAFNAPITAFSASIDEDFWFAALNRFVLVPMFLFSGTFFPIEQLPGWLQPVAWATPLWHGVELCRDLASGSIEALPALLHAAYLLALAIGGTVAAVVVHRRRLLT